MVTDSQIVKPALLLIVDDEGGIRKLVSNIVQQHGYRFLVAKDVVEAISTAQREHPALVLLDVDMPRMDGVRMDGVDVCRILKQGRTTSQVKVIMVTVFTDRATRQRASAAGADGFLSKPFSMEDLLETIEGVLGSR